MFVIHLHSFLWLKVHPDWYSSWKTSVPAAEIDHRHQILVTRTERDGEMEGSLKCLCNHLVTLQCLLFPKQVVKLRPPQKRWVIDREGLRESHVHHLATLNLQNWQRNKNVNMFSFNCFPQNNSFVLLKWWMQRNSFPDLSSLLVCIRSPASRLGLCGVCCWFQRFPASSPSWADLVRMKLNCSVEWMFVQWSSLPEQWKFVPRSSQNDLTTLRCGRLPNKRTFLILRLIRLQDMTT